MSACMEPQAHPTRCGCGVNAETDWRNALRTANEHTKQLLAERDTLRTANQRLEEDYKEAVADGMEAARQIHRLEVEVARLKADSERYQFLKENCQQDVDGYKNETPVLVHALSHIPEWRNRIDETIDAALAGDGGDV